MNRQRVEKLVRDDHAFECLGHPRPRRFQPAHSVTEHRLLSGARLRASFDQVQVQAAINVGVARTGGAQDVGGELAVTRTGFDEVEGLVGARRRGRGHVWKRITGPTKVGPYVRGPTRVGPYIRGLSNVGPYVRGPTKVCPAVSEDVCHLGDLDFQELAEEGADVHAGKKIARASGSFGRAGVVAEPGMVEREVHERGHRHRAAITHHVNQRLTLQ